MVTLPQRSASGWPENPASVVSGVVASDVGLRLSHRLAVSGGGDTWFESSGFLGQRHGFQLSGHRQDAALQGGGFDAVEGRVHGDDRAFAHRRMSNSALMRGGGFVMFFDDFGPASLLGNQLLLRQ